MRRARRRPGPSACCSLPVYLGRRTVRPDPAQLLAPALGVPVTPRIDVVFRNNYQMPRRFAHYVIATRAPISLLSPDLTHIEALNHSPFGRRCPGRRRLRLLEVVRVPAVLPRHQRPFAFLGAFLGACLGACPSMNWTTTGAIDAPTSRGSSLRDRSNE